ncbi:MAG: glycosyl hydrolase, partial [Actinomycetota bacterium]
ADFWGSPGGKNYHVTIGQNTTFYLEEAPTGHQTKRVIDGGTDRTPGVRVSYWLPEAAEGEVTLAIVRDSDGAVVDTYTSDIPDDESARAGRLYLTAAAGMNTFQWPMRHPAGPGVDGSGYHKGTKGPLAMPGGYTATLRVGDAESSQSFELLIDPRVTATPDDFAAQFDLLSAIQAKLDETVAAVNRIGAITSRLDDWSSRLAGSDADLASAMAAVREQLGVIDGALIQRELTSDGDSLNYREQLLEKLTGLPPVVGSSDAAPTRQSHQVFEKLAGQIDEQLAALDALTAGDLAALNDRLADLGGRHRDDGVAILDG